MPRRTHLAALLILAAASHASAAEFQVGRYKLKIPDGFEVRLAADPALAKYPICADFDDRGRLYVCESSGTETWNKPQPKETPHRVLRLEDSDGDGVFDRRTVFAEFEMMAQGAAWIDGSLYVAAAPVIWKLTDADGDGTAERREEWIKTDAVTGCLNDLRGPYRGPDGYVYWCKGPATHTYTRDGKSWTTAARHVLRRHPRGGDVDVLMVGGMDNPVEIAFAADGERFVTCTNFQMLGTPRDDGILHAVYGGVYPKDIQPVFEFPWTGPDLLPKLTGWGALSPAGLMCYRSNSFGPDFRGNLFSALFSGHKVMRHVLTPQGGTFASRDEDFLTCDDVEFHPTEVMEDADGSMLVIDTGGWYRHCCPSSTFYRPDVRGAIYRITKTATAKQADPRGLKIDFAGQSADALIKLLDDPRWMVRRGAVEQLARLGAAAIPVLQQAVTESGSAQVRLGAVWAAAAIDHSDARAVVRTALADRDAEVRHAALNSVSHRRDEAAAATLLTILDSGSPADRRVAAEALGRIRIPSAVAPLLNAATEAADRLVEHAVIYALIEIAAPDRTRQALSNNKPAVRRAALIALDQMPGGDLEAERVIPELNSSDPRLRDATWWIVSRHAREWGPLLADYLKADLASAGGDEAARAALKRRLASLARAPGLSTWIVDELTSAGVPARTRMLLVEAMGDAGGQFAEPQWVEALLRLLADDREAELRPGLIATLRKLPPTSTRDEAGRKLRDSLRAGLLATAADDRLADGDRLQALAAIRDPSLGKLDDPMFAFLIRNLAPEQPLSLRSAAAEALARSQLTEAQLTKLAGGLKNLAPTELNVLLALFQDRSETEIGRRLVGSLSASAAAGDLNAFRLRSVLAKFDSSVQAEAKPLFACLEAAQAEQLQKADRVLARISAADPHRGIQVFQGRKASCTACHKAAHVGGVIGPHLQGVGKRRTERDLIESILFPSASLVQSFETWTVVTDDGRTLAGVLLEDRPDEIVLSAGVDKTYRLPRSSIEEMARSPLSIMPTGLDKTLTDDELADLIAYLKSL